VDTPPRHVPMTAAPLRVALLGAGTVGGEVVRAFAERHDRLAPDGGRRLELVGIAVRDVDAARDRGLPADLLTDAPAHLVADPDTDIVIELLGGDEPAHTLVRAALGAGKSVVTANKHIVAHHGPELESIARRTGAALRFEAAVGGGIPILGPLAGELAANEVIEIKGIVNGTMNYILTAMVDDGRGYAEMLEAAQAAGYAEADPSGDVEGHDAVNKLVILVRLAFGVWHDPADVAITAADGPGDGRPGITGIATADLAAAAAAAKVIKLIASARRDEDGRIVASVLPTLVSVDSALGRTAGVLNRIEIEAVPVGRVAFDGPGAGGPATSSAVLGDLLAIARGLGSTWAALPPAEGAVRSPGRSVERARAAAAAADLSPAGRAHR
jgi:homoserine dehydrogenase